MGIEIFEYGQRNILNMGKEILVHIWRVELMMGGEGLMGGISHLPQGEK